MIPWKYTTTSFTLKKYEEEGEYKKEKEEKNIER